MNDRANGEPDSPPGVPRALTDGEPRLRLPAPRDVDRIVEICSVTDVARFTNVPAPYGPEDAEGWIEMAAVDARDGSFHLVAVDADDHVLGAVGIGVHAPDLIGNIGYWMAPDARGRGLATALTRRVCRWGLDERGLRRIELDAAASNAASNAVARRLGFTLEGTRRSAFVLVAAGGLPETRDDLHVWGLLPGELR